MVQNTPTLRPRAVADYLSHRFRFQPGEALCVALGQPDSRDNYQALAAWVEQVLPRHLGADLDDVLQRLEADLYGRMCEAGLIDQVGETFPVPVGVVARLWEPRRAPCRKDARQRRAGLPFPALTKHLGTFGGGDAHE